MIKSLSVFKVLNQVFTCQFGVNIQLWKHNQKANEREFDARNNQVELLGISV